jgi:hypothetical protein
MCCALEHTGTTLQFLLEYVAVKCSCLWLCTTVILIADCMYSSLARKASALVNEDQSFYLGTQSYCVIGN